MSENLNEINQLLAKLDLLIQRQNGFQNEINDLRQQVARLRPADNSQQAIQESSKQVAQPNLQKDSYNSQQEQQRQEQLRQQQAQQQQFQQQRPYIPPPPREKTDFEKWIGENLISKIGIAILVLGVGIGAKFAIDNGWISPLTRIILAYLIGAGLLGFAIKLKAKYENFSAVLLGGALAILYFVTYLAYDAYQLFPQSIAFTLMVLFTVFTVVAAIHYNKQIIAHLGLVGAYAVPFLLSDGSGKVAILFSYIALLNIGILAISFKRNWKSLFYVSFALTWIVYLSWYLIKYEMQYHFTLAIVFAFLYFLIFYATNLAYKLIKQEKFNAVDVIMLLLNAFIFYGIGYSLLDNQIYGSELLGLFTLANALIHFIISAIIYRQKLGDRNLFYLSAGLVMVFVTIAIPVQLDGNWVTMLWAGEAALLFWIGRTKAVPVYEKLSFPLLILAAFSLWQDWSVAYNTSFYVLEVNTKYMQPIFNIHFFTALFCTAVFGFMLWLSSRSQWMSAFQAKGALHTMTNIALVLIFLSSLYFTFANEIMYYFDLKHIGSVISIVEKGYDYAYHDVTHYNYDYENFKTIWMLNYSFLFFAVFSLINIYKVKNSLLAYFNLGINAFCVFIFLGFGLYILSELRASFLDHTDADYAYYVRGSNLIWIRYVTYIFVAMLLYATYLYTQQAFVKVKLKSTFEIFLHTFMLWLTSSELINLLDLSGSTTPYGLGLSILWGVYALLLIVLGIWKQKKYLRIAAMVLFGITLLKLFLYDISSLSTIAKTIVFVLLGIFLLIISFLYNKYKAKLAIEPNLSESVAAQSQNLPDENNN